MLIDEMFPPNREPIPSAKELKKLAEEENIAKEKRQIENEEKAYHSALYQLSDLLNQAVKENSNFIQITIRFGNYNNYNRFEKYVESQGYHISVGHRDLSKTYRISW